MSKLTLWDMADKVPDADGVIRLPMAEYMQFCDMLGGGPVSYPPFVYYKGIKVMCQE